MLIKLDNVINNIDNIDEKIYIHQSGYDNDGFLKYYIFNENDIAQMNETECHKELGTKFYKYEAFCISSGDNKITFGDKIFENKKIYIIEFFKYSDNILVSDLIIFTSFIILAVIISLGICGTMIYLAWYNPFIYSIFIGCAVAVALMVAIFVFVGYIIYRINRTDDIVV